jgi:hypothetical protein
LPNEILICGFFSCSHSGGKVRRAGKKRLLLVRRLSGDDCLEQVVQEPADRGTLRDAGGDQVCAIDGETLVMGLPAGERSAGAVSLVEDLARTIGMPIERREDLAAEIAVKTVEEYLASGRSSLEHVIFNVFTDRDYMIYRRYFDG